MTSGTAGVDHYVYATPTLTNTITALREATGVALDQGGVHDIGTANYLAALTYNGTRTGSYLEVIGVDPARTAPITRDNFGLLHLRAPQFATFCVPLGADPERAALINAAAGTNRTVTTQSRRTPSGTELTWHLLAPQAGVAVDPVPFAIDWGTTPHPAQTITAELELVQVKVASTDPEGLAELYDRLDISIPIIPDDTVSFELTVRGPAGEYTL